MKKKTYLTLEERIQIEVLLNQDISCKHIAERIGRSINGITTEVRKNGGKKLYNALDAHAKWSSILARRRGELPLIKSSLLITRIENLEMQLEILTETIRGLKHD